MLYLYLKLVDTFYYIVVLIVLLKLSEKHLYRLVSLTLRRQPLVDQNVVTDVSTHSSDNI